MKKSRRHFAHFLRLFSWHTDVIEVLNENKGGCVTVTRHDMVVKNDVVMQEGGLLERHT